MSSYVVAIPSYNRSNNIADKVLTTLREGNVPAKKVYVFVANRVEEELYKNAIPRDMYNEIVVGKLGITNQRNFITQYFPVNQYIVSLDDDITSLQKVKGTKYVHIHDLDAFFKKAYQIMKEEGLYIWGVYPAKSLMYMKNMVSTDLKFIPGFTYGFINRRLKELKMSPKAEGKEDIEQSILYYLMDGGVVRFNYVTPNQTAPRVGGLGKDRMEMNQKASEYMKKTYPDIVTIYYRKNGLAELKLARLPRV